jgi:trehalose 6-phosphate phosphatase
MSPGLPVPRSQQGVAGLRALLRRPERSLLAFDFDGTLAPIVADPTRARAHPDVVPALRDLAAPVDAIAIVTGRPAATALEYGGFADVPGLLILGQYGRERWADGALAEPEPDPGVAVARRRIPALLREAGSPAGVWVEDKGNALAVHTRRTGDPAGILDRLREPVSALAHANGLIVEPGRFVLELRPPGMDKGLALRDLVAERGSRAVLYAGDDLGDLPAYDAIDRLRADGVAGVTVCSASAEETALAERADIVVDGPAGVAALIAVLATEFTKP